MGAWQLKSMLSLTANGMPDADIINFDASLSGMTIELTSGELLIANPLTINGLGS